MDSVPFLAQHQPLTWSGARLRKRRSPMLGEHNEERLIDLMLRHVAY